MVLRWRSTVGFVFFLVAFTTVTAKQPGVTMRYDPDKPNRKSAILWLAYVIARTAFHEEHKLPIPASGEIPPSFAEEVHARTLTAQTYRTLKAKDSAIKDPYWETLSEVESKGFMRAYVWVFLHRKEWPASDRPPDLDEFNAWKKQTLPQHVPQTLSWIEAGN